MENLKCINKILELDNVFTHIYKRYKLKKKMDFFPVNYKDDP